VTLIGHAFAALIPGLQTPIEKVMEDLLRTNIPTQIPWASEVDIDADGKGFRADFVASSFGSHVGIECDGADFHDFWTDHARDMRILTSGRHGEPPLPITDMIRFRGCDLVYEPSLCLQWLRSFFPQLFDVNAVPLTPEETALASAGLRGIRIQPVVRTIVGNSGWLEMKRIGSNCLNVSARDGKRVVVQMKSPYWRKPRASREPVLSRPAPAVSVASDFLDDGEGGGT
jgi:hypothetical protein